MAELPSSSADLIRPPFLPSTSATDQVIADLRATAPSHVPFEALERCVRRFYEDRAMLAHAELDQIHQQLLRTQHDKSIDQAARHEANAALKWLKHQPLMQTIESLAARVGELFGMLKNEDGWRVVHNSEGISTSYKQETGTNIVSMKVHAVFDCPVLDLLTLVSEIDLMPLFIKLLAVDVQVLKEASDFCKTIRVTVPLPWPLAGRDAIIDGQAIDMLSESGCVVVLMRQLEHGMHADLPVPEPAKGLVRIDVQQCGAVIRPLDEKLSYVEFVFRVDPKLAVVPDFLINFFTRKLTHMGTCLFRDQCRNIPCSEFEDRQLAKVALYADIRLRLEHYFTLQGHSWTDMAKALVGQLPKRDLEAEQRALEKRRMKRSQVQVKH